MLGVSRSHFEHAARAGVSAHTLYYRELLISIVQVRAADLQRVGANVDRPYALPSLADLRAHTVPFAPVTRTFLRSANVLTEHQSGISSQSQS